VIFDNLEGTLRAVIKNGGKLPFSYAFMSHKIYYVKWRVVVWWKWGYLYDFQQFFTLFLVIIYMFLASHFIKKRLKTGG